MKNKKIVYLGTAVLVISLILLLGWGIQSRATSVGAKERSHHVGSFIQSPWANQPVTIDGVIETTEWEDATEVDVTCEGALSVTAYLKNDESSIFIAIDDLNDEAGDPECSVVGVDFDDEPPGAHDGAWTYTTCPSGEGIFFFGSPPCGFSTFFRGLIAGPTECPDAFPAVGVNYGFSSSSGHAQWEVEIDFSMSELKASPGQMVGLSFGIYDVGTSLSNGDWPCGLGSDPAYYGDLVLTVRYFLPLIMKEAIP